jgi:hypothetical protein
MEEETADKREGEEVYYVEPDFPDGIEGVDYDVVHGVEEKMQMARLKYPVIS